MTDPAPPARGSSGFSFGAPPRGLVPHFGSIEMSRPFQNVIALYPPLRLTVTYKGVTVSQEGFDEEDGPVRPYYWNEEDVVVGRGLDALEDEGGLVLSSIGEEPAAPGGDGDASAAARPVSREGGARFFKLRRPGIDSSGIAAVLQVVLSLQLQRRRLVEYRELLARRGGRRRFWAGVTGRPLAKPGLMGKLLGRGPAFTPRDLEEQKLFIEETADLHARSKVRLVFAFEPEVRRAHEELKVRWAELRESRMLWSAADDRSGRLERRPAVLDEKGIGEVESDEAPMHFVTDSKVGIFVYPAFVAVEWPDGRCAVMDLRRVEFRHVALSHPETDMLPSDAKILGQTYSGSTKDGRAASVPTVAYGDLTLSVGSGLKQRFIVSDIRRSEAFAKAFEAYKESHRHESDLFKARVEEDEGGLF